MTSNVATSYVCIAERLLDAFCVVVRYVCVFSARSFSSGVVSVL